MFLSRALDAVGLRVAWLPDKWAVYEATSEEDEYLAVTEGTSFEELRAFTVGAKYGEAYGSGRKKEE